MTSSQVGYDPEKRGAKCRICPLRGHTVVPGEGPPPTERLATGMSMIAVVGEAPGEQEERQGRPFVGPSGEELDRALRQAGLDRRKILVCNILACRPPGNDLELYMKSLGKKAREEAAAQEAEEGGDEKAQKKRKAEVKVVSPLDCCMPRFLNEVDGIQNFITLGKTATKMVTGQASGILSIRGGLMELEETAETSRRRVMPTVHPAFVLRQQRWAHVFRSDVHRAAAWFQGRADWVPPNVTYNPTAAELDAFLSGLEMITFDLETEGLECLTTRALCIGLGDEKNVMMVGLLGKDGFTEFYSPEEKQKVLAVIKKHMEDPDKPKVSHNGGYFDRLVLENNLGIHLKMNIDTILLHRSVESELPHNLGYLGSIYANAPAWKCYDGQTEVLTPSGWVFFAELERGVPVAQWSDSTVSFVRPAAYVDQPYAGKMWRLEDQATDLLVTPDHKMVYRPRRSTECREVAVQDLPVTGLLPHVGTRTDGEAEERAFVQLIAAFQADGSWAWKSDKDFTPSYLDFGFTKPRKIERLKAVLTSLGMPYSERQTGAVNPRTRIWVDPHPNVARLWDLLGREKRFGPWTLGWDLAARHVLLDELPLWDGTLGVEHRNYNTTDRANADWVQACAVISGRAARRYEYANKNGILPAYRVSLPGGESRSREWSKIDGLERETVDYDGRIYCVSVPSGFLLVRRNGKVTVSGNTDRKGAKIAKDAESDEELHKYCLMHGTRVLLGDGTTKPIEELVWGKYGGEVMSLGPLGMEAKRVVGWHCSLEDGVQWVRVSVEGMRERDRGLIVTADHKIIGPRGPVEAARLVPGDLVYDSEPGLTEDEVCAILGTLLGDSCLAASPDLRTRGRLSARSLSLQSGHVLKSGLAQWKLRELPILQGRTVRTGKQAGGFHGGAFLPLASPCLRQLADLAPLVYDSRDKKRLQVGTLERMGPRGWAWWYADDGCVQKKRKGSWRETMVLATNGFPREDVEAARAWFCQKFGRTYAGRDNVLRLGVEASESFAQAIAPFLPEEARYKLPKIRGRRPSYRPIPGHGPLPSARKVVSVEPFVPAITHRQSGFRARWRFCLDVEDNHNFFTTLGLVHNCSVDVVVTARVLPPLIDGVRLRDQLSVWKLDQKVQALCVAMHRAGMYVDQEARLATERKMLQRRFDLLKEIRDRAGKPNFNPGSVDQMQHLLFTEWGLEPPIDEESEAPVLTASGQPSTADFVMRALLTTPAVPEKYRDVIKLIRYFRKVQKLLGTYVCKMRPATMEADLGWDDDDSFDDKETREKYGMKKVGIVDRTGRMHPGWSAHTVVTGRLSSSKPINAQNYPVAMRALVTAAPGNVLVAADMDQLELRVAASLWQIQKYLKAFAEGKDPHSMTAFMIFAEEFCLAAGVDPENFSRPGHLVGKCYKDGRFEGSGEAKQLRTLAKTTQFAFQYMASVETGHKVIQKTEIPAVDPETKKPRDDGTTDLPYAQLALRRVREMREKWIREAPEYERGWNKEISEFRRQGYLRDPVHGRRRDFLDGEDVNALVNFKVQCAASSVVNDAMTELFEVIPEEKWGPGTGIICQVHDQIVVECPEKEAEWVQDRLKEVTNREYRTLPGVKLSATPKIGKNWKEV